MLIIRWRLVRAFFFTICFLGGVLLTLGLGPLFPGSSLELQAKAQTTSPAALVQVGVDAYGEGQYQTAIESWEAALIEYINGDNSLEAAIVRTNLAQAQRQLGQTVAALEHLQNAEAIYERLGMVPRIGRIKTEQAQLLTSLGQYRRAIALICPLREADADSQATLTTPRVEQISQVEAANGDASFAAFAGSLSEQCLAAGSYAMAHTNQDFEGEVAALGSLGEAYRLMGDQDTAIAILELGVSLVNSKDSAEPYKISMLNSLGNAYGRQAQVLYQRSASASGLEFGDFAGQSKQAGNAYIGKAAEMFRLAATLARQQDDGSQWIGEWRSQLNLLKLHRIDQEDVLTVDLEATQQHLEQLQTSIPASREKAFGLITLATSYRQGTGKFSCFQPSNEAKVASLLEASRLIADEIGDDRTRSFALGELGNLEQCRKNPESALDLTIRAQIAASNALESADSLYLWQWQQGYLYESQGKAADALQSYEQAIATLAGIRNEDIVTNSQGLVAQGFQFDFRDAVEPLYRRAIELQLELSETDSLPQENLVCDNRLDCALKTFDSLKLAELQNFFGDECLLVPIQAQDVVNLVEQSPKSAVISSIIFPEQTALILSIQGRDLQLSWIKEPAETISERVKQYLEALKVYKFDLTYDRSSAEQLYRWLIAPFEDDLQRAEIDTLVFVQDGILSSVPMAALGDGEHYLIETYAIATVPSLTLTDPQPLRPEALQVLRFGLSERWCDRGGKPCWNALENVESELDSIPENFKRQLPARLNQDFSKENLELALQESSYPVLHLATHGQFSADPESAFIAIGNGEKLTFAALDALIRKNSSNAEPVEMLILTACETGIGDNRATLGLAGVAIRAGARSAIASLWPIDDETTAQLVEQFYQSLLDPGLNKAQALQRAQTFILKSRENIHPGFWAPFILVGNWL